MLSRVDTRPLFAVLDTIVKLAYANLLWLGTTLAGLVVVGLWPATVALFACVDDLMRHGEPVTWRSFARRAYAERLRANVGGWLAGGTVFVLGFYLVAASNAASEGSSSLILLRVVQGALLVVLTLYLCGLLYVIPTGLRSGRRGRQLALTVAYLVLARPLHTVSLALVPSGLVLAMFYLVPAALIFFAISAPAYIVLFIAGRALEVRNNPGNRLLG